ncbi:MAG: hypothetical protein ACR2PR_08980 [Pseudohongiellaceae bacterium]
MTRAEAIVKKLRREMTPEERARIRKNNKIADAAEKEPHNVVERLLDNGTFPHRKAAYLIITAMLDAMMIETDGNYLLTSAAPRAQMKMRQRVITGECNKWKVSTDVVIDAVCKIAKQMTAAPTLL